MSENKGVQIRAEGLNESRLERIRDALCAAWDIEEGEIHFSPESRCFARMHAVSTRTKNATESAAEFAGRMAKTVWNANCGRCPMQIRFGDSDNVRTFCERD